MSAEEVNKTIDPESTVVPLRNRTSAFGRAAIVVGFIFLLSISVFVLLAILYRVGYLDSYVKNQLVAKMSDMGIAFDAEESHISLTPLQFHLTNVSFNDKVSGDKLIYIRDANFGLTITDIFALRLSRDIKLDSTDISGAEVWITFDENGKSNFSRLKLIEDDSGSRVNFKFDSVNFSIKDGLIHFGDVQHKISAAAKNVVVSLSPFDSENSTQEKRYNFDLNSTKSNFIYDEKTIEPIDLMAKGIADAAGAEISELRLSSPIGSTAMSGNLTDWHRLQYVLNINSTIDLQQTATIFPTGATLRGLGNFDGKITGEGSKYQINVEAQSDALSAGNVYLKGLVIDGKVSGENSIYDGNGKAIAEMLTFEDFRIDFPQMIGNIRGNGADFKWFGELQAAAAKSPIGTLAGLFVSDAIAEFNDNKFSATLGRIKAGKFVSDDVIGESLLAGEVRITNNNGETNIDAANLQAGKVKLDGAEINDAKTSGLKLKNRQGKTEVSVQNLQAENLKTNDVNLKNVTADGVSVTNQNGSTEASAENLNAGNLQTKDATLTNAKAARVKLTHKNGATDIQTNSLQAEGVTTDAAKIGGLEAGNVSIQIHGEQTDIASNNLKIAKIETNAAVLGSLNIAGVRLKIVRGTIEGTSGDIDAGNIDLKSNGKLENAKLYKPVFVLEPSGRYRASMDMSLGGGVLGSVKLGAAKASVVADNEKVSINNIAADVMNGKVIGNAIIALNSGSQSQIDAGFTNLDLSKLIALQGGKIIPIGGKATGKTNLTFTGTNLRKANGTLIAEFDANAGTEERGLVPINGGVSLKAINGLFNIDYARFKTEKSKIEATGRFDLNGNDSNLSLNLDSSDANEIDRLVKVLNLSPDLEQQLSNNEITFAGKLNFNGALTGNIQNPNVNGRATLEMVSMRGHRLGSIGTEIMISPSLIELRDGILREPTGGFTAFNVGIPQSGLNNVTVQAMLTRINSSILVAVLPLEKYLPEKFRDFNAETSGAVNLSGLPNDLKGSIELKSGAGSVAGQPFESFETRMNIQGYLVDLESFNAHFADGYLKAKGTYQRDTKLFDFDLEGKGLQATRLRPLITDSNTFPDFSGTLDLTAKARGKSDEFPTYNVNFAGTGQKVTINDNPLGTVSFNGTTQNQILKADLSASIEGQTQIISTTVNFSDENLPFRAETNFNQTEVAPFVALFRSPGSVSISGKATGKVFAEGNLYAKNAQGEGYFTTDNIKGIAQFSEFGLLFDETPIVATQPIAISFSAKEVVVENAHFAGAGSNLIVSGTKALNDKGINNLSLEGAINMRLLNLTSRNTFYTGIADLSMQLTGTNNDSRLSGSATIDSASISTFIGSERLNFERIQGRVLFTSNQAQIERAVGYLGGGKVVGSGGALVEGLKLQQFRLELRGQNVTAPLPKNFLSTGDAEITITGKRDGDTYNTLIAGRVFAKRSTYSKDVDLADLISNRRDATISEGTTAPVFGIPKLDIILQGRDALIVKNNLADLTASVDMRVTGDVDYPVFSGRVTANNGTGFFRSDRYEVQRGTVEFPPQAESDPLVNVQAETEIKGYQVYVNLVGSLSGLGDLKATVRSNPSLPQADVISLITTGNLTNTESGIPTYAQNGLNTAAEVIADSLINNPIRKATDKLFGLNKFGIDPIISGKRLSPSARLTVGRQINNNLAITYSTNLSQDQNQVFAVEYRVSNKLSFVAQYEQRSLSNVTRNSNDFSFEIRLRKRF